MAESPAPDPLRVHRQQIDQIDRQLVELLCQRAEVVAKVGQTKRSAGLPVYAPHREREVIDRAVERNRGPLSDRTVEAVFREIMSGSFRLELPIRVGFLGPPGTFSHLAAKRHFGSSVDCVDLGSIDAVFAEVEGGRIDFGLAPYENSIGGSIVDTLEAFQAHRVRACAEALINVSQCFMANCAPDAVRRIYSRSEVFQQCRKWLAQRYPKAELVPIGSSALAVERAAAEGTEGSAAIGSSLAGELLGVNLLFDGIQDRPENITRFLVIGREEAKPSGKDKTVILFTTQHKPGALVEVLDCFRQAGVNLSHVDKRPSGRENWQYCFFIDADAHQAEEPMQRALAAARTHCSSLEVLGSFPRAQRIL